MKTLKKTLAILLALVMVAALGVSAFAAEIKVDNVKKGETYEAYKLLEYTSDTNKEDGKFSYYLNAGSEDLKAELEKAGFEFAESADHTRYVVTNTKLLTDAEALVEALKKVDLSKALVASKEAASDKDVVFSDLTPGYYFVTTTTGSLCTLKTYTAQDLIVDKHEPSTVVKTASKANANVGDTVTYTVTVNAKKGETVTLTDELSKGLTLKSAQPTIAGATVVTWDNTADASKIVIKFDEVDEDTTFTVTYEATINSSALTLDEVNNDAKLTWGNNQSTDAKVVTKLFRFDINKVDEAGEALDGVKFTLTNADNKYYDGQSVWTDKETILTTDKDGKIEVKGIAAGTYTLTEVETKDGYNLLDKPVIVTVDGEGNVTVQNATANDKTVTVVNTSGSILPDTGSIGTTIFYILGSILVIGAGIVLVSKRRMTE